MRIKQLKEHFYERAYSEFSTDNQWQCKDDQKMSTTKTLNAGRAPDKRGY